ncbi:MAG: preprotein translocase subunit YajC [Verrucomicrobiota bacterium]|nr:preprotein translocase subunit YajC [Verrucomicrobiota bacterium]
MITYMALLAFTSTPPGTESTSPGWSSFVPIIFIFVAFYFVLIRPQMKKQKQTEQMVRNLKTGDKVVTVGGMLGTVASVKNDTVVLKVAENVKLEFQKSAVSAVTTTKDSGAPEVEVKK